MKNIGAFVLCAIFAITSLVGCTSLDLEIQKSLPAICANATQTHNTFIGITNVTEIDAKVVRAEEAGWNALVPLCLNPSEQTTGSVLIAATAAYAQISAALKEARRNE